MITIFANIKETRSPFYISVDKALERIKNGKSKDLIMKIRREKSKELRNEYKQKLPSVLFSGTFKQRNNHSLMDHSGLICLDFDELDPVSMVQSLKKDEYIFAAWVSPSGNGVKALVKIPKDDHGASFAALQERYKLIDKACKDVSRVCYESYDPLIHINRDSKTFTEQIKKKITKVEVKVAETDSDEIYDRLKKWLDKKGEYFTEGSRNVFVFKLAAACCRFGIPKSTAELLILRDFIDGSTDFQIKEFENCLKQGYKYGFNTAAFEKSEIVEKTTREIVSKKILDLKEPIKDVFYAEDVYGDALYIHKNGQEKAGTTHFKQLDQIFRWLKGQITVLHGMGNHGKSTIMFQLLLLRAIYNGEKFAIFSPEQYPATDFYNDLAEMYTGKDVEPSKNQMTQDELYDAYTFINNHFFFVYPENDEPTPDYILEKFHEMIVKKKISGVVVDPFNQLEHDYTMRDDKYLSKILSKFKRFALMENVYFLILAHPRGGLEKDGLGNYKAPYYTELSGGMMWGNKADNILCYHRPYYATNPKSTECMLISQKIKRQKICGRPGSVDMDYDLGQNCFLINGENPLRFPKVASQFDSIFPTAVISDDDNPF